MVGKNNPLLPMGGTTIDPDDHKDRRNRIDPMGMVEPRRCIRNPRFWLLMVCLWPIALLALMASSSPGATQLSSRAIVAPGSLGTNADANANANAVTNTSLEAKFHWRSVLDRVDVMGYGPTHPRVAFVVVGETKEALIDSVKSVFSNTDMRRIFVICAVLDSDEGLSEQDQRAMIKKLRKIENGSVPHWHGLKRDVHKKGTASNNNNNNNNNNREEDDDDAEDKSHSPKIHVLFHSKHEKKGLATSRSDAVEFVQVLAETHESAGLKSHEEDLILVLMQGGTKFHHHTWLTEVTSALIVPPPLYGVRDPNVPMKLANAVSFRVEALGQRTSFGPRFSPVVDDAPADDMNLSNGNSIPTPALNGAAVAMRLDTFSNLPSLVRAPEAMDPWLANLELSLNLWLCADGIDILEDVEVTPPPGGVLFPQSPIDVGRVAKLASVWMDDDFRKRFYVAYSSITEDDDQYKITRLDWETEVSRNRRLSESQNLLKHCRSFEWYTQNVNKELEFINKLDPIDGDGDEQEEEDEQKDEDDATEPQAEILQKEQKDRELPAVQNEEVPQKKETKDSPVQNEEVPKNEEAKDSPVANQADKKDGEAPAIRIEEIPEKKETNDNPVQNEEDPKKEEAKESQVADQADKKEGEAPAIRIEEIPEKKETNDSPVQNEEVPKKEEAKESQVADQADKKEGEAPAPDNRKKPSKPLRHANLEIVKLPKPIDIAYVDVSNGHKEHPHMPALDDKGLPGYIHDETALRKNPPAFNYPDLEEGCNNRDDNYRMMHERIVVETEYNKKMEESGTKRVKIFCLVYTIEKAHPKIPLIRETWAPKCDGFMVGSTKTDPSIDAVNIPHEGPEEYDNIWQKVRSMWSYIYDNYYEKYDWFHIGGDDLFLLVENLRYYLESEEIRTAANGGIYLPEGNESKQVPLLLGRRFAYLGDMNNIFDSGGSGYTMNKAALKLLVTEGFPNYFPHRKTFSEDTMVATLFKKTNMVLPYDTKDDAGGERYMPFLPGHHYSYRLPEDPKQDWYANYSIDIKEGPEHCSPQSVAFHYVKGDMMKRLFALAYGLCPK